jgi:hypothetical protein
VLFTDLVNSTEMTVKLGGRQWHNLLDLVAGSDLVLWPRKVPARRHSRQLASFSRGIRETATTANISMGSSISTGSFGEVDLLGFRNYFNKLL